MTSWIQHLLIACLSFSLALPPQVWGDTCLAPVSKVSDNEGDFGSLFEGDEAPAAPLASGENPVERLNFWQFFSTWDQAQDPIVGIVYHFHKIQHEFHERTKSLKKEDLEYQRLNRKKEQFIRQVLDTYKGVFESIQALFPKADERSILERLSQENPDEYIIQEATEFLQILQNTADPQALLLILDRWISHMKLGGTQFRSQLIYSLLTLRNPRVFASILNRWISHWKQGEAPNESDFAVGILEKTRENLEEAQTHFRESSKPLVLPRQSASHREGLPVWGALFVLAGFFLRGDTEDAFPTDGNQDLLTQSPPKAEPLIEALTPEEPDAREYFSLLKKQGLEIHVPKNVTLKFKVIQNPSHWPVSDLAFQNLGTVFAKALIVGRESGSDEILIPEFKASDANQPYIEVALIHDMDGNLKTPQKVAQAYLLSREYAPHVTAQNKHWILRLPIPNPQHPEVIQAGQSHLKKKILWERIRILWATRALKKALQDNDLDGAAEFGIYIRSALRRINEHEGNQRPGFWGKISTSIAPLLSKSSLRKYLKQRQWNRSLNQLFHQVNQSA